MTRRALAPALTLLASCGQAERCGPETGVVTRVIDGDTVELSSGRTVRYLTVDAPEISTGEQQCYGPEASAFNRSLVQGKTVRLDYDEQCEDRYGRLLAYVGVDGRDLSSLLLERGYACVLYIPPNGSAQRARFEALQADAERAGRGMWGQCEAVCP